MNFKQNSFENKFYNINFINSYNFLILSTFKEANLDNIIYTKKIFTEILVVLKRLKINNK